MTQDEQANEPLEFENRHPGKKQMRDEVIAGLMLSQKMIPAKYLYDEKGSILFDQICEVEEYYPTQTEMGILRDNIEEIAELAGPNCLLVEYGSGSGDKTRILLEHLVSPAGYVPIEISKEALLASAKRLTAAYPHICVLPVCADFSQPIKIPSSVNPAGKRLVFFPGSTIGNMLPEEATSFLKRCAKVCGPGGGMLIGVDLKKDTQLLEAAYNDSKGVSAAFALNVLDRFNRELDANFDPQKFGYHSAYNNLEGRIEMGIRSFADQIVKFGHDEIGFAKDEVMFTEFSHKFSLDQWREKANFAGFDITHVWTDAQQLFSVQYMTVQS